MKIILPRFIYRYFYNIDVQDKWMLFELKNFKLKDIMMGNSFKALYNELKNQNDSQN